MNKIKVYNIRGTLLLCSETRSDDDYLSRDDRKIISVVDIKLHDCQSFQNILSTIKGIDVVKFTDPIEALDHLKLNRKNYAVMISDLRMPVIMECSC